MSLLSRLGSGHLGDRAFAQIWVDGGAHPHLAACAECRARFDQYNTWVLGLGDELRAEADRAFPADRLAAQQAQIVRRLEALERPARVIAFPRAARAVVSGHSHVRRWVTVGVAAGLIAGVGLGQMVDLRHAIEGGNRAAQLTATQSAQRANGLRPVTLREGDEEFLTGGRAIEPRVQELAALDDMTPHMRDLEPR